MLASKTMDIKKVQEMLSTIESELDVMLGRLGDEMAHIREKVDALNEEFISNIFKSVFNDEMNGRESKYKKYFDHKFQTMQTAIELLPALLISSEMQE
jgi:hypothetical protein